MISIKKEVLKDLLTEVKLMKHQIDNLKQVKLLEAERHQDYIVNCHKILNLVKERQKDYVLDQIIQMDESVRAINTDIQAFKNIRT